MKILIGLGVVAAGAVLAACSSGSSGKPSTSPAAATPSASPSRSGGAGFRGPAASGIIAEVSAGSIEVQSTTAGQVTVTYTAKTAISDTASTSLSAVKVGSCVLAAAQPPSSSSSSSSAPSTSFTAATVFVSPAVGGKCQVAGGFGGGGGRGPGGTGTPRSFPRGFPSGFPTGARPSGARSRGAFGNFERADGKVTAINGSTITVSGTNPRTQATTTYSVTVNASTKYMQTVTATAKALTVGKCAAANGKTNDTGAVAATSIRITPAVNGSCDTGFGGRRPGSGNGNG
jgi:Domain of unknown function (DUF5666)